PFFVAPETMFTATSATLPAKELYVVINGKLTPDFDAPDRKMLSVLARAISVALANGLRAELMLVTTGAQRLGVHLSVARIPERFKERMRSLFDPKYMQALFNLGVERGMSGTAFERHAAGVPDLRTTATP